MFTYFFCGTRRLSCCDILRKGVRITGFDVQKMLYYFAALTFTWPGPREFQRDTSTNPNRGNSTPSPPTCWVLGFCGVYDFGPFFGLLKGPTGGYIIHHCPCFKVDLGVLWVAGRILMESRGSLQSCPMISEGIDLIPRKDVTRIDICIYIYVYIYIYIPRTQMTSIFEAKPLKTRPFATKSRAIWVPGIYIYIG